MTRAEHMRWAKERALDELDRGSTKNAVGSMLSDLGKHPDTAGLRTFAVTSSINLLRHPDAEATRRWIEGFAE